MKKTLLALLALILVLATCTCQAAEYTLPEKMHNQLAIGSGLKGTFSISSEGEMFNIPFLKDIFDTRFLRTVSDAEYNLRGILSGKDLHYYVLQSDEQDQQKNRNRNQMPPDSRMNDSLRNGHCPPDCDKTVQDR